MVDEDINTFDLGGSTVPIKAANVEPIGHLTNVSVVLTNKAPDRPVYIVTIEVVGIERSGAEQQVKWLVGENRDEDDWHAGLYTYIESNVRSGTIRQNGRVG
jgi:hypothetical protein